MRRALLVLAGLAVTVVASPADAAFYGEGATVVSASKQRQELADDRSLVADISRDGRFVAFETRATNFFADDDPDPPFDDGTGGSIETDRQGGVFRRDVDSGALDLVADGDLVRQDDATLLVRGARNPSVSADGRFVVFSTAQRLVPEDDDTGGRYVDVYVRDMGRRICRPLPSCAGNPYTLVSALDGSDVALTYGAPAQPTASGNNGSDVTPATSISDDGRTVAFRTLEVSNAATTPTPANQLFVRRLDGQDTRLVTRVKAGQPTAGMPAGGAQGPTNLSGDGTAVAWSGRNAEPQTRFQPGEQSDQSLFFYLWQRVADGAAAPTRRITGLADPDDPACAPGTAVDQSDPATRGPCYGPLASYEEANGSIFSTNVALSADGYEVAFLTATQARASGQLEGSALDVSTTSMRPGATRKGSTRELTRESLGDPRAGGSISGVAMSGDGRKLAVTTSRSRFLLPALRLVGATRSTPGTQDLYLIDRDASTIERVLVGLGGLDPDADVETTLSVADGARRIAFVSGATNLFAGDANQRVDAFVAGLQQPVVFEEPPPPAPEPEQQLAEGDLIPDEPELSVRLLAARKTGERIIEARPPAAGAIAATASGRLPGRDGKRRAGSRVQVLARARGRARRPERVRMTLKLSKARITLLRRLRTLETTALVEWVPDDRRGRALRQRVTVEFRVVKAKKATKKKPAKKRPARRGTRRTR